jgi:hypothetical protein
MSTYLIPKSFNGVAINGTGAIDSQEFKLPFPKVLDRTLVVAGGDLFDFNYGQGGKLQAAEFPLTMSVQAATAAALGTAFNNFFGLPPTGFYGMTYTFIANIHGSATTKQCQALMLSVDITEDADWYEAGKTIISEIKVVFKPFGLFV